MPQVVTINYKPFPQQKAFHDSDARIRALIAGIGGGKTYAGANEIVKRALQRKDTYWICVAPTYQMLKNIDVPEVERLLPRKLIKKHELSDNTFTLVNGSRIQFLSGDNPDRLRGTAPDGIWVDEGRDITSYAWSVIYTRATRGKKALIWVTTTPNGYDWIYNEIYVPFEGGNPDYFATIYKSIENPWFDADTAEEAKRKLSPEFYRQEYEASFEYFTGRVYKDFDRKIHVKEVDIPENWSRYRTIDFGYVNPTVCLWVAKDPQGVLYIYDEYHNTGKPTKYNADMITQKSTGQRINMTYGDPSAKQLIDDYGQNGIYITPGNADVLSGINRVTEYLKIYGLTGKPRLYVSPRCENTIREFENYRWSDSKGEGNAKEAPLKKDDHCMDALRYFIFTYTQPQTVETDPYVKRFSTAYKSPY